jgi:hypothetical protein
VTCIEHLSNELFYEIFDYLDSCDIFDAFTNLNTRFEQFMNSPCFLFKIYRFSTTEDSFKRYVKQVIIPNTHKIVSICLYDQVLINLFSMQCNIDPSFHRLESLVLRGIKIDQLLPLLKSLSVLSRLFSLNIHLIGDYKVLSSVYKLIFKLFSLKYIKFSSVKDNKLGLLPVGTSKHISTIEQLNINHRCTVHNLNVILSYTPQLRRLTCQRLLKSEKTFSQNLVHLTHISINECYLNFDTFESFIKKVCSKLQVLRLVDRSHDITYLDADRWKRLISQYIPHLHTFDFQFCEKLSSSHTFSAYHSRMNQFKTAFWIEHQWIFELETNLARIIYSIHRYR